MTIAVGVEDMMRAERPLVIPQNPSSLISWLKVSVIDVLPSTCTKKKKKIRYSGITFRKNLSKMLNENCRMCTNIRNRTTYNYNWLTDLHLIILYNKLVFDSYLCFVVHVSTLDHTCQAIHICCNGNDLNPGPDDVHGVGDSRGSGSRQRSCHCLQH